MQAILTSYTLEKKFFVANTFEGLWDVSFQTEYKTYSIIWSVWVSLHFHRRKDQVNSVYGKSV